MAKEKTSLSLSAEAKRLLKLLKEKTGLGATAMLETLIREKAKAEKIK